MRLNIDLTQGKMEKNVFFISDFHMFHSNVLKFDNRPFKDIHEMHHEIETRWNSVVGSNDIVIFLGDLDFAKSREKDYVKGIVYSLNGTTHIVLGNHDKRKDIEAIGKFETISDYLEVSIKHIQDNKVITSLFCCMHYPLFQWNKKHFGSFMVHGHSHTMCNDSELHKNNKIIDVSCNGINYTPISYTEIIDKFSNILIEKK